ncbi:vegetative incompatibility protein HET-E-1-like [Anneissia japonica]|uniref:vegetative incompatibility protein HET-E-1-like n=1 Tax=Anneissia japonica TaxID=1529436 RepID=UPI001425B767|nr:vegetative incompatibility protein HET-E-1-like [Anneissia japonica]XP_033108089.1 vegetative incompatibility protein HET-E-1-like [Anneissia japonica]XP_033108090.1 vegetative incompatibility protein HET-E-1-like [Anneissia japonica]
MARRRLEAAIQAGRAIEKSEEGLFSDLKNSMEIKINEYYMGVYSLQFSLDGSALAVGCGNGAINLYNSSTGEMTRNLNKGTKSGLPIMSLNFHPFKHDLMVSADCDGNIKLWNIDTCKSMAVINERKNEINALDFSSSGEAFATGGKDLSLRIYDTERNELSRIYEGLNSINNIVESQGDCGHGKRIFALKFHPDADRIFFSGGWDDCIKIWDSRTSNGVQGTIPGPHICGSGLDVKDGKLLTASWVNRDALQIFDWSSRKLESTIPVETDESSGEYLYSAQFCDNNVVIAGGSGTNNAQAISKISGKVLGKVDLGGKPVQALDSTHGGRLIAVGGGGTSLKLAQLV